MPLVYQWKGDTIADPAGASIKACAEDAASNHLNGTAQGLVFVHVLLRYVAV
jgi:hypothetical protein